MTISAPTFVKASLSFSASSLEISAFTTAGAPSTNFLAWNQKQTCYTINKYIIEEKKKSEQKQAVKHRVN